MAIFLQSNLLTALASRKDVKILLETFLELLERSWEQEEVEKQWTVYKRALENHCGRGGKGIGSTPLSLMVRAHVCACKYVQCIVYTCLSEQKCVRTCECIV